MLSRVRLFRVLAMVVGVLLFLAACNMSGDPEGGSDPEDEALAPAAHGIVPVTVTISRFVEIEDPDPAPLQGDGDYYARVTIGGFPSEVSSSTIEAEDFEPFWTFSREIDTGSMVDDEVPVVIEIFDSDPPLNPDDEIDINPVDGVVALTLLVDPADGSWRTSGAVIPDNQGWSEGDGDTEHSGVFEGGEIGRVFFGISVLSADGDADGDGLIDSWELWGLDADADGSIDVDLPGFGADPLHKDVFLELDWMAGNAPSRADIQELKDAFGNAPIDAGTNASALSGGMDAKPNPDGVPGINLWVDTGGLTEGGNLVGDDLGGGNQVPASAVPALDGSFYAVKNANFDATRRRVFRYGLMAAPGFEGGSTAGDSCFDGVDNDGDGDTDGDDDDCWPWGGGWGEVGGNDFVDYNHDAGTLMHEFGHNLNLRHGGNENANCKPNYVSVMNYDNQFGIRQAGGGSIIDYSPPRFATGRGSAALPTLDENGLDESVILDGTDSTNQFVFKNADGDPVRSALDQPVDWNGDGDTSDSGLSVNIDTSPPDACDNGSFSTLEGFHDWDVISIPFRQFGDASDGAINPVEEPEITLPELVELEEDLNTTDLAVDKIDDPDPVAAGEELTYTLTITNEGPNPASDVVVTDVLPDGVTYLSDDSGCAEGPVGTLTCELGEILARESVDLEITVEVAADLVFNNGGPLTITNTATVTNDAGPDPDASNNTASEDSEVVAVADLEILDFEATDAPSKILIGEPVDVTLHKTITNNGPSAPMDATLTVNTTAPSGISVTPADTVISEGALALDEDRGVDETFTVECLEPGNYEVTVSNLIEPANAEDTDPVATNNGAEVSLVIDCVIPVAINISPGSDPNSINPRGRVTVAVLTTIAGEYGLPLDFDATSIDPLSVRFGDPDATWEETGGAFEQHDRGHIEDSLELDEVTMDGDDDMVLHFRVSETGLEPSDTEGCAFGEWTDSSGERLFFFGCDAVRLR